MAKLSDEEKAKKVLSEVDSAKKDETAEEVEAKSEAETVEPAAEDKSEETEEEASTEEESEAEAAEPFTKQFPNLKGETIADYVKELEQAYTNSTTEAIRLKREADARAAQPADPAQPVAPAAPVETNPDLLYVKSVRERDMNEAFDKFATSYPNVREGQEFDRFTAASDGVWAAWTRSHNNQAPTFDQLYKSIADVLGWEPVGKTAKKDNAIKTSGVSSSVSSATAPAPKTAPVSDKEIEVYMRMVPGKSVEDARKEIASVKV